MSNKRRKKNKDLKIEIKERRAILESTHVEIQTINEYKQLKEELNKRGLSIEDPNRLLTILKSIKQLKYDPNKIVAEFSRLNSLRRTERILKNNCQILENRMSEDRQVLPLLQRIRSMGIGIDKLQVFSVAVYEKAEKYNMSISAAAYRVIEDIENYNRIGGMNKEIARLAVQIYANESNLRATKQSDSIFSKATKLMEYTDQEILNVSEYLNRTQYESATTIQR